MWMINMDLFKNLNNALKIAIILILK